MNTLEILIVDDDGATCECLAESLQQRGHLTAVAHDGDAAIPMLPYVDAVICDGLNGDWIAVAYHARRLEKRMVVFTGQEEIREEAMRIGVPCILKPAAIKTILAAIEPAEIAA